MSYDAVAEIRSKVYEDNNGAIALAKRPYQTSRIRHLHTKYHSFKDHLKVENGDGIEIEYIDTTKQIADILLRSRIHTI